MKNDQVQSKRAPRPLLFCASYFLMAAVPALAWCAFTLYAALDHNPQGAYDEPGAVVKLGLFHFAWFFLPSIVPALLLGLYTAARGTADEKPRATEPIPPTVDQPSIVAVVACLVAYVAIGLAASVLSEPWLSLIAIGAAPLAVTMLLASLWAVLSRRHRRMASGATATVHG